VTFDGLLASALTFAQFNQIHSKMIGKSTDPDLGLVLDYLPFYPPVVSQVVPNTGPSYGGTHVTIFGANFESAQTQVYFGSNKAREMNIASDSVLTVETPGGFGVVDVTVVTPAGISAIVPEDQYTYIGPAYLPPILDYISPNHGKSKGGTRVKIEGEYFLTDDTFVYFGDSAALDVEVVSTRLLYATVPPGKHRVNVKVITPFGVSQKNDESVFIYDPVRHPPRPPENFIGIIQANKFLNMTQLFLEVSWIPSPSNEVVAYEIYRHSRLVATIPATDPSVYVFKLSSRKEASSYKIVAVKSNNKKSKPISIRII
jgi:hypothetical protein